MGFTSLGIFRAFELYIGFKVFKLIESTVDVGLITMNYAESIRLTNIVSRLCGSFTRLNYDQNDYGSIMNCV